MDSKVHEKIYNPMFVDPRLAIQMDVVGGGILFSSFILFSSTVEKKKERRKEIQP